MRVLVVRPEEMSIEAAVHSSGSLLAVARRERAIVVSATSIFAGPTLVLGRLQHAARVLDLGSVGATPVLRRTTTGTGFMMDGGVLVTLALPYVDAAFADATARSFLNRNVRPLMRGFESAGVAVSYFGREWLSSRTERGRAVAVLGVDIEHDGALLVEAYATAKGSLALPPELKSALESSCDRYRGRSPASLTDVGANKLDVEKLLHGVVERLGLAARWLSSDAIPRDPDRAPSWVEDGMSPIPRGATVHAPQSVPIGFLDVATSEREIWIGGDVLAPSFALGRFASWRDASLPIEGALWDDVRRIYEATEAHARMSRP